MIRRILLAGLVMVASSTACEDRTLPPRGQLVVYVDTDAPLGLPPGSVDSLQEPAPLFDRLRTEVVLADGGSACLGCTRDFVVTRDALEHGGLSFAVVPEPAKTDLFLRARLFRGTRERGGVPRPDATLDRVFALPSVASEGIVEVTARLPLEAVGLGPDFDAPGAVSAGRPAPQALHAGVRPRRCSGAARPGEVCAWGGAFWMSDPRIFSNDFVEQPERVVIVSPFWIDGREVTVADVRASGRATASAPVRAEGSRGCTYTEAPGPNEDLPVNCVDWSFASDYCAARGGRLVTEAERELLAGGRRSLRYVWGDDDPNCEDMVFAREDAAFAEEETPRTVCALLGIGPRPAGSSKRDALALEGGTIVDLGGNVQEWTADAFQKLGGRCWPAGLLVDPSCGEGTGHTVRGSSWYGLASQGRSTARSSVARATNTVGFRCARSDP